MKHVETVNRDFLIRVLQQSIYHTSILERCYEKPTGKFIDSLTVENKANGESILTFETRKIEP